MSLHNGNKSCQFAFFILEMHYSSSNKRKKKIETLAYGLKLHIIHNKLHPVLYSAMGPCL